MTNAQITRAMFAYINVAEELIGKIRDITTPAFEATMDSLWVTDAYKVHGEAVEAVRVLHKVMYETMMTSNDPDVIAAGGGTK